MKLIRIENLPQVTGRSIRTVRRIIERKKIKVTTIAGARRSVSFIRDSDLVLFEKAGRS